MKTIPLVDLAAQFEALKTDMRAAIDGVLNDGRFIQGPAVQALEREFQARLGTGHAIGCANGTAALSLALEALGIGRDDEVITTAHTFIATAEAICHIGAKPVFVDIGPSDYCLSVSAIEAAITPRTRAIVPVHLYGTPCDMDGILEIARRKNLKVVEDAAQAHFAAWRDKPVGTFGDCTTFSFYPGKNLGAYGDAGMIVAKDSSVATLIGKLRDHGRSSKYEHDIIGYNQRLDSIQAAVLSVKLRHIDGWNSARRRLAARYDAALRPAGFKTIEPSPYATPVYHLYVAEVSNRDDVIAALAKEGIATGIHYPVPLHHQKALAGHGPFARLPVTERIATRVLSLPIYPELTEQDQDRISDLFLKCAKP